MFCITLESANDNLRRKLTVKDIYYRKSIPPMENPSTCEKYRSALKRILKFGFILS